MMQHNTNQVPYGSGHMMQYGEMDSRAHQHQMQELCTKYHNHLVQFETTDGNVYDGIIDSMDEDGVNMLVPVGEMERDDQDDYDRQFGYGGYSPYGYGGGYPRRFRRFRRYSFPYYVLRRLFLPYFY